MNFFRFFGLFFAVFALAALASGCKADDTPDAGETAAAGTVFYGQTNAGTYLFISIFSDTGRLIALETGGSYKYAAAEVPLAADGSSLNYSGKPASEGAATVGSGGNITFTPSSEYPNQTPVTGSLKGSTLSMAEIPGVGYKDVKLGVRADISGSASYPFGPGGPTLPSGGGTDIPQATSRVYDPGKIITEIKITKEPDWGAANSKIYYEGDLINFSGTGMEVVIYYNDGTYSTFTESQIASNFTVDPPCYWNTEYRHKLYYSNGFSNEHTAGYSFYADFTGPIYENIRTLYEVTITSPANKTLSEWYEDDNFFTGATVKATYSSAVAGSRTVNLTNKYKAVYSEWSKTVDVSFGSRYIEFDVSNYYKVLGIAIGSQPKFAQQVLVDDPRLLGSGAETNAHWLNKLADTSIIVTYSGGKTRTIQILEAYNNNGFYAGNPHSFITPPAKPLSGPKDYLGFSYYGKTAVCDITLFDALTGISVAPKSDAPIMIYEPSIVNTDPSDQLLNQRAVSATYESGMKGPTVTRNDVGAQMDYDNPNASIDPYSSELKTNLSADLLNTAAANFANGKGKFTKATVSFTTNNVTKQATVEIGAIGEFH